jgi:hypothetical protein
MAATILCIAGFAMVFAKRTLFPVRHYAQAIGAYTELDQIVPGSLRSLFAQHQVIG